MSELDYFIENKLFGTDMYRALPYSTTRGVYNIAKKNMWRIKFDLGITPKCEFGCDTPAKYDYYDRFDVENLDNPKSICENCHDDLYELF